MAASTRSTESARPPERRRVSVTAAITIDAPARLTMTGPIGLANVQPKRRLASIPRPMTKMTDQAGGGQGVGALLAGGACRIPSTATNSAGAVNAPLARNTKTKM